MSNWHYQLMYHDSGEGYYAIHEYFPFMDSNETVWTSNPITVTGESVEDIKWCLKAMLDDIDKHGVKNYESR